MGWKTSSASEAVRAQLCSQAKGTPSFVEPPCLLFKVRSNAPLLLGFSTASSTAWWNPHNPCTCKSAAHHHTSSSSNETRGGSSGAGRYTSNPSPGSNASRPQAHSHSPSPEAKTPHSHQACTVKNAAASPPLAPETAAHEPAISHPPSSLSENEIEADLLEETKKVFGQMDVNQSGLVEPGELQVALTRLGLPSSQEYLQDVLQHFDSNHDNTIDFTKFNKHVKRMESDMEKAFRSYDTNGDGSIDCEELGAALSRMGLHPSERQVRCMMDLLDTDKSGAVSYKEFRRFACMLPRTQVVSPSHIYFAWANSALWLDFVSSSSPRNSKGAAGCSQHQRAGAGESESVCAADVHKISSPNETARKLLVGGLAGVIARTLIAPIERLRTIVMLSTERLWIGESVSRMWQDGGFKGLFRGHLSTVIKVFPCTAIQFTVFDATKKGLTQLKGPEAGPLTQLDCFLAGCMAGGCACLISHPLDTIRTQMSVASGGLSMMGVARTIGMAGLYRGFGLSCFQEVIGNGLGFLAVDMGSACYQHFLGRPPSGTERSVIAAVSAMVVMTAVMPLDLVVKRIQVQGSPGHPMLYSSALDAFARISREEGLGAFYKGMLATYCKTAPSMGALYFFFDLLSRLLGVGGLNRYRAIA